MPLFKMLLEDHKQIIKSIDDILINITEPLSDEIKNNSKELRKLFNTFLQKLHLHYKIEEELLYSKFKSCQYLKKRVMKAGQHHAFIQKSIDQLKNIPLQDDFWETQFMIIRDNILLNLSEEENEIFPVANEILSPNEKESLAEKMQQQYMLYVDN